MDENERFWSKVDKTTECWIWTGSITPKGYGQFYFRGTVETSHRVSWILTFGDIPNNLYVCHICDNPKCVRPDHLFVATQATNLRDMMKKGRRKYRSRFSEEELNELITSNLTYRQLSSKFNVSIGYISRLRDHG
jgi:hypothetical protein